MNFIQGVSMDFWTTLLDMAPYLLFGFAAAGVLSVLISTQFVEKHLGGRGIGPVIKASLAGVPLPLCSCSVIPVAVSLRRHGASKAATTSFLISTPQIGVESILATFSLLGPVFAVFRPLAAFMSGVIGGALVQVTGRHDAPDQPQEGPADACCAKHENQGVIIRMLKYGFMTIPRDIALPLLIGLIVAGLISALVPDDFFAGVLGSGIVAMLVMMLLGLPVYVCATASIPVAAAMIAKGITPGAALVFLMTGPATNAASFITLWRILGPKATVVYFMAVAGTSLMSGMALDALFQIVQTPVARHHHSMLPMWVKMALAIALLAVLAAGIFSKYAGHRLKKHDPGCSCDA